MTYQNQQKELTDKIVASLLRIKKHPEGWLPHTVFVEEEGYKGRNEGRPVYCEYKLLSYLPNGTCLLCNCETGQLEHDDFHLSAINIDWLVTIWENYRSLCVDQGIEAIDAMPEKELYAFVWHMDHMDRDASDSEILDAWEHNDENDYEVEKLSPDELAERLNDECYAYATDYIRFIYTDK